MHSQAHTVWPLALYALTSACCDVSRGTRVVGRESVRVILRQRLPLELDGVLDLAVGSVCACECMLRRESHSLVHMATRLWSEKQGAAEKSTRNAGSSMLERVGVSQSFSDKLFRFPIHRHHTAYHFKSFKKHYRTVGTLERPDQAMAATTTTKRQDFPTLFLPLI
jgi:hypothetical protein